MSASVTLVSSDGFSYVVSREAAMISGTIRGMLESGNFIESQNNRVTLQEISGMVLEKVCEYLCYNLKYKDQTDVADFDISPEMSLELLMAADYLDGKFYPILSRNHTNLPTV
ncbi:hypothetical protein TRICI_003432 [Trichomonascus ciferrii]|uniref:Elongin-C n=1 Tax=Trichomonascus ciferrii TaxID=44093 RepID=A0A642V536_9ASCO|nr:hypothetical protein TRICI_003432 [Trichomonascus ciferrii]